MLRFPVFLALSCAILSLAACSSNLSRFDVINAGGGSKEMQVTRAEVADQGSGEGASVVGPGGHSVARTTVGGYYLRRTASAPAGSSLVGGLHGNPRANR